MSLVRGRCVRIRDRRQGEGVESLDPATWSTNDGARSELSEQHVYPLQRHPDQAGKIVLRGFYRGTARMACQKGSETRECRQRPHPRRIAPAQPLMGAVETRETSPEERRPPGC